MTLLELLGLIRKHIGLVVGLCMFCAAATAVVCWGFLPNQYTAEVSIYALSKTDSTVTSGTDTTEDGGVTYNDLNASQMLANDFAELAKNDQVQADTAKSLGMTNLDKYKIEITSSSTTRIIKVDVTGADAMATAVIANKLAEEIGTTAVRVMDVSAVNIINKAKTPEKPSGPHRLLYTLIAFLVGLFLAIIIIVLKDMLNTTIRSDEDVQEILGLPVIGRFPYEKGARR